MTKNCIFRGSRINTIIEKSCSSMARIGIVLVLFKMKDE